MKHVQLFEQFLNEMNPTDQYDVRTWNQPSSKVSIYDYIDLDPDMEDEIAAYHIERMVSPKWDGENMKPKAVEKAIKKTPRGIFKIRTSDYAQSVLVRTDRRGNIKFWDRDGSAKAADDGDDRFEALT